ncbi:WXG100 family type VII secretion target [Nocardioides jensenii]|uniref:WXG100 family type VII secretion target n=1 Tax=Nocardioides jensenii TaxID=1843 RepID=UPI0008377381|nr:WXG100 family type VII secretion target [Nocardioides jensenii]
MSIDLTVDGSPSTCREAARQVRALNEQIGAAGDMLARCMLTAASDWTGDASDAFTSVVKERIHRADDLHEGLQLLATELGLFAAGLTDVKAELQRARAIAVHAGIPVGATLPEMGEVTLETGQEGSLDHAVGVATRAREHEQQLQSAWRQCLQQVRALQWDPVDIGTLAVGKTLSTGPASRIMGALDDRLPDLDDVPLPAGPISRPGIGLLLGAAEVGKKSFTLTLEKGQEELRRRWADGSLERDIRKAMYINGVVVVTGVGAYACARTFKGVKFARCVNGAHDYSKKFGKLQGDVYFGVINRVAH